MPGKPAKYFSAKTLVVNLGCAAPLVGSYYIIPRYTLPFDFYDHYFFFIIIHLYNIFYLEKSSKILPTWLVKGLSVFVLTTLIAFLDNRNAFNFGFAKQFFGAIFSASSYYIVFRIAKFNVPYLFNRYMFFAFIAALLGILEEILHLSGTHVKAIYMGSFGFYRVGGLSGEPYNLSMALFPAMFYYLLNLFVPTKYIVERNIAFWIKCAAIFIAFFLTFSSTGYAGLFISFVFIGIHSNYFNIRRARVLLAPIFFATTYFLFGFLTNSDKGTNRKFNESIWFLKGEDKESTDLAGINSSSFALLSNYYITMEGFKDHPVAGIGLGNYEILYNAKFDNLFGSRFEMLYGKSNYNDANSMFLRLLAETGIIGIVLFCVYLVLNLIKSKCDKNRPKSILIAINHGILILFLIRLLRCGNYLSDGMFFFVLLYYYSHEYLKLLKKKEKSAVSTVIHQSAYH